MGSYTQLTEQERYQIYALKSAGLKPAQISKVLGRDKATISRELKRNKGQRGYRPKQAQQLSDMRKKHKSRPRISDKIWSRVEMLLRVKWSPEQISTWLLNYENTRISHEWIYQYILNDKHAGGDFFKHLRCQKKRKKRYGSPDHRGRIKDRVSIDERPKIVDTRVRIGDWEADTMVGSSGGEVLVTLVERKTRWTIVAKAANRTAKAVRDVIIEQLMPIKEFVKTITYDNGKEFALHKDIDKALNSKGYFAHPYHSWERGLNENTNGLIRQYYPKGFNFSKTTDEQVFDVSESLNNRPRKCLEIRTPNQVFWGINPPVALTS